jgi:uncharacterized membrane protein YuzA (DUF378 family)
MIEINQTTLKLVATLLVISGALNWLSIGTHNPNLVAQLAGSNADYVYMAVGAAGIYLAYLIYTKYKETGKWEAYQGDEIVNLTEGYQDEDIVTLSE